MNDLLLVLAAVPLFTLLAAAAAGPPTVELERTVHPPRAQVGDVVTCEIRIRATGGPGLVEVHQALPGLFSLAGGTNLHVLAKGLGAREARWTFSFRATKRGDHVLPPLDVEVSDALGFLAPRSFSALEAVHLPTRPPLESFRRLRNVRSLPAYLLPRPELARVGPVTTSFEDIREYVWGDPPRAVNWKATARRLSRAGPGQPRKPLVNEREREDRRSAWFLVDAAGYMEVGTTVESALDHVLRAAGTLSQYLLDRGFRVGATIYNAVGSDVLYPDSGTAQRLRISEALRTVVPDGPREGLRGAVQRSRAYLVRENPLVVVLTRVGADPQGTLDGIEEVRALLGRRSPSSRLLVVNVEAGGLVASADEDDPVLADVATTLGPLEARAVARVRARQVRVLSWDPHRQPFERALLGGARP